MTPLKPISDNRAEAKLRSAARAALWGYVGGEKSASTRASAVTIKSLKAADGLNNATAIQILRRGISSRAVEPLGVVLGIGKGEVVEYLDLDRSTVSRRVAKGQALPNHSAESLLRLAELEVLSNDVFENEDEATSWMHRSHPLLDNEAPLQSAKSSFGAQRVKDLLIATKYGFAA